MSTRRKIRLSPFLENEVARVAELTGESVQSVLSFSVFFGVREFLAGGLVDPNQGSTGANGNFSAKPVLTPDRPLTDPNQGSNPHASAPARSSNPLLSESLNTVTNEESVREKETTKKKRPPEPEKNDFSLVVVFDLWNSTVPSLPKVHKKTAARRKTVKARQTEKVDFEALFVLVEASDFLTGRIRNDARPFKASFDWVLKPANLAKVVEGNFGNDQREKFIDRDYAKGF